MCMCVEGAPRCRRGHGVEGATVRDARHGAGMGHGAPWTPTQWWIHQSGEAWRPPDLPTGETTPSSSQPVSHAGGTGRTRRLIDEDEGRTVEALFSLESWTDRACYLGCILVHMKAAHVEGEKHVVCLALWPWASFQF
jgi:hypothetical protein